MSKRIEELEELSSAILINNDMYKIPVDLIKIASNNKIDVYKNTLVPNVSGAIRYYKEDDRFVILLNKDDPDNRQRFTLAHELGHYFLHKEILKSDEVHVDTLYRISNEQEKEVDYFAGALLMNELLLKKIYTTTTTSISELAQLFQVSESAMTVRLDVLELL